MKSSDVALDTMPKFYKKRGGVWHSPAYREKI